MDTCAYDGKPMCPYGTPNCNRPCDAPGDHRVDLIDVPMRLKYMWHTAVIDAGPARFEEDWYDDWLDGMVETDPDIIFFLVTESTDVFEKEWDFNETPLLQIPNPPPQFIRGFNYGSIYIEPEGH